MLQIEIAILGLAGIIITAGMAAFGSGISHLARRLEKVEDDLNATKITMRGLEQANRRQWLWGRGILALYYKYRSDGAPEPEPFPESTID